jgi:hypothetical protein
MNAEHHRISEDNCKSEKLREIILETIGLYPHQYSHQARFIFWRQKYFSIYFFLKNDNLVRALGYGNSLVIIQ